MIAPLPTLTPVLRIDDSITPHQTPQVTVDHCFEYLIHPKVTVEIALKAFNLEFEYLDKKETLIITFNQPQIISSENAIIALTIALTYKRAFIKGIQWKNCQFTPVTWQIMVQGLNNLPELTQLGFKNCQIEGHHLKIFQELGFVVQRKLKTLLISCNPFKEDALKELNLLIGKCLNLRSLNLNQNGLTDKQIKELLSKENVDHYLKLHEFFLSGNFITDEGARKLSRLFAKNENLEIIDLSDNAIADFGLVNIFSSFRKFPTTFLLNGNPITNNGLSAIRSLAKKITNLSLVHMQKVSLKILHAFKNDSQLEELNLCGNAFSDQEVENFCTKSWGNSSNRYSNKRVIIFSHRDISSKSFQRLESHLGSSFTLEIMDDPVKFRALKKTIIKLKVPTQEILEQIKQFKENTSKELLFKKFIAIFFSRTVIIDDGNCFFHAVVEACFDELSAVCPEDKDLSQWLREKASQYIKDNKQDFAAFIDNYEAGDGNDEERIERYEQKIAETGMWAGQHEQAALVGVLASLNIHREIIIFDFSNPPNVINGELVTNNFLRIGNTKEGYQPIYLHRTKQSHYDLLTPKYTRKRKQEGEIKDELSNKSEDPLHKKASL